MSSRGRCNEPSPESVVNRLGRCDDHQFRRPRVSNAEKRLSASSGHTTNPIWHTTVICAAVSTAVWWLKANSMALNAESLP